MMTLVGTGEVGVNGFRVWVTDELPGSYGDEKRCHCGWLDGREHYGTVRVIDADRRRVG